MNLQEFILNKGNEYKEWALQKKHKHIGNFFAFYIYVLAQMIWFLLCYLVHIMLPHKCQNTTEKVKEFCETIKNDEERVNLELSKIK